MLAPSSAITRRKEKGLPQLLAARRERLAANLVLAPARVKLANLIHQDLTSRSWPEVNMVALAP
jgi:hypothetical protein